MMISELTHGSLFSGIGGFELAARNEGIKTLWNCEINEYNRQVLKKNFPESKQYKDITTLMNPEYVDILSGGFPCQDISVANAKGEGINGSRSGLWSEYARIIRYIRPKYIIIENSSNLLVRGFERVLCDLSESGYDAEWQCLQAKDFGYPHKRERVFVLAYSSSFRVEANKIKGIFNIKPLSKNTFRGFDTNISREIWVKTFRDYYTNFGSPYGFSNWMDRVAGCGNAVVPAIAKYLFECIKDFDFKLKELAA